MSIASRPSRLSHSFAWLAAALPLWAAPTWAADESPAALQKRCDGGDGAACNALGLIYEDGVTVAKDQKRAITLFRRACDLKHEDGCLNLESRNIIDQMVFNEMRRPAEGPCAEGDAVACFEIGTLYKDGYETVAPDTKESAGYFTKACNGGHAKACLDLGLLYFDGAGVDKNAVKANDLFRKASDLAGKACAGNSKSATRDCRTVGAIYEFGLGVAPDPARAQMFYDKACELGDKEACGLQVADAAAPQPKPSVAPAPGSGAEPPASELDARCKAKDWAACGDLGYRYQYGQGLEKDVARAATLYGKACDGGSGSACHALAQIYDGGQGVAPDPAKSAALLVKACKLGDLHVCPAPAAGAPSGAAPAPAAKAATGFAVLKMRLGSDTVASVERDIKARGGTTASGGSGVPGKFTLNALSGDYPEVGPTFMAINYDFDATGPTGRLIAVTIVHKSLTGAPYATLVAARKAAIAQAIGPLQQKSVTELTAQAAGIQATLFVNSDTGFLYEVYRLSN